MLKRAAHRTIVPSQSTIPSHPHSLHPIIRLPNELVGEILKCGSFQESNLGLTISHVSQYFRNIALSTPVLWTQIVFKGRSDIEKAAVFLQRSRNAGLDVYIRWSTMADVKIERAKEALEVLFPHMSRVVRLEFWSWNHTVWQYLLQGIRGTSAARLKTLLIHVTERQAFLYDPVPSTNVFCAKSIQLETLSIGVSAFNVMHPPLAQIKSMVLKEDEGSNARLFLSALQKILDGAAGLERLALVAARRPIATWQQIDCRTASKVLTTLRFTDCPISGIKQILQTISPSSLKHLTIENSRIPLPLSPQLLSLIPSLQQLVTLEVRAVKFLPKNVLKALRKMDKLCVIHLELCTLDEEFVAGLEGVCPLLYDLALVSEILYDQIHGYTPWRALQQMIRNRHENPQVASIRKLKVREQFGEYEHIEAIDNLRRMVSEFIVV